LSFQIFVTLENINEKKTRKLTTFKVKSAIGKQAEINIWEEENNKQTNGYIRTSSAYLTTEQRRIISQNVNNKNFVNCFALLFRIDTAFFFDFF
jgi:NAD/NADP transhydrogenase alpha subunit